MEIKVKYFIGTLKRVAQQLRFAFLTGERVCGTVIEEGTNSATLVQCYREETSSKEVRVTVITYLNFCVILSVLRVFRGEFSLSSLTTRDTETPGLIGILC
jgi:hypothetical protein